MYLATMQIIIAWIAQTLFKLTYESSSDEEPMHCCHSVALRIGGTQSMSPSNGREITWYILI